MGTATHCVAVRWTRSCPRTGGALRASAQDSVRAGTVKGSRAGSRPQAWGSRAAPHFLFPTPDSQLLTTYSSTPPVPPASLR